MKMKVIDRILLALYALLGILMLIATAAGVISGDAALYTRGFFQRYTQEMWGQIAVCAVILVLVIWSARLIVLAFRHETKKEKGSVSVQNTEDGAVRVSVAAMDTLVRQAIGKIEGVTNVKTHIVNHEDSITVQIEMTVTSEVRIPGVTMMMQRSIKRFIEEYSGIAVREVTVLVSEVLALEAPAAEPAKSSVKEPVVIVPEKVEIEQERTAEPAASEESAAAAEKETAEAEIPVQEPVEAEVEVEPQAFVWDDAEPVFEEATEENGEPHETQEDAEEEDAREDENI